MVKGVWGLLFLLATVGGCAPSRAFPQRPLTIICPWAAGGGTDRVSRQIAVRLEQELGVPVTVVNATGGKGVTGHNRGLRARSDGHTLTMMTFELNTMHWMGLTDLNYQDCLPLMSLNEDYAALLLRQDATWKTLSDLEEHIRQTDKPLTASGTAVGGCWHLALAGWLDAAGMAADAVVWVPSAGANPSLQQLISGGVDLVCCSLPEARTLLEAGEVRALGVMSPQRAPGFEQIPTFAEQGRDWMLGGWRGLGVPRGTPPETVALLSTALERIVSQPAEEGTFAHFMEQQKFDHTWRTADDFRQFLSATDQKLGALLESEAMQSVSRDRFSPMTYPAMLSVMLGCVMLALGVSARAREPKPGRPQPLALHPGAVGRFLLVPAVIAIYMLGAEALGFLPLATVLVFVMLWCLGTRVWVSLLIAAAFVPLVFVFFSYGLRVPLPRGWWG